MGPIKAVISCYVNILNFSGRARRAEYWWFFLFLLLIGIAVQAGVAMEAFSDPAFVSTLQDPAQLQAYMKRNEDLYYTAGLGAAIYVVLGWLPQLSVTIRRLHDTDHSGWFIFMPFLAAVVSIVASVVLSMTLPAGAAIASMLLALSVQLIASIWFLVVLCLPGTRGSNRFGPDPAGRKRRPPAHPAFAQTAEPEERAAMESARRAEIKAYYRKNVLPGARRA